TNTVTMRRDGTQNLDLRGAQRRVEMVELHDVVPRGKVGIFAKREVSSATSGSLDTRESRRILAVLLFGGLNVIFRVLARPGAIDRCMVTDEIEKQRHAPCVELLANRVERIPCSDARIGHVLHDRIG